MNITYYWSKILKKIRFSAIKKSTIHKTSKVESGSLIVDTIFDKHSFCGYDCEINKCDIGSFTSIANNVIIGGGMHPYDWVSMSPVFYEGRDSVKAKFSEHEREELKRTHIGHDVWIGQNVLVKQGVSIGNGAVVGMGSVVTKDIEPYAIYAGVPAKLIKYRFEEEIIKKLLTSEWWKFDDEKLRKYSKFFTKPEEFLKKLEE